MSCNCQACYKTLGQIIFKMFPKMPHATVTVVVKKPDLVPIIIVREKGLHSSVHSLSLLKLGSNYSREGMSGCKLSLVFARGSQIMGTTASNTIPPPQIKSCNSDLVPFSFSFFFFSRQTANSKVGCRGSLRRTPWHFECFIRINFRQTSDCMRGSLVSFHPRQANFNRAASVPRIFCTLSSLKATSF